MRWATPLVKVQSNVQGSAAYYGASWKTVKEDLPKTQKLAHL